MASPKPGPRFAHFPAYCLPRICWPDSAVSTVSAQSNVVWQWVRPPLDYILVGKSRPKTVWPSVAPRRLSVLVSGKPRRGKTCQLCPFISRLGNSAAGRQVKGEKYDTDVDSLGCLDEPASRLEPYLGKSAQVSFPSPSCLQASCFCRRLSFRCRGPICKLARRRRLNSIRTHLLAHLPFMCIHYLPPKECAIVRVH